VISPTLRRAALAVGFVALTILYGAVGFLCPGYDDEFTNIVLVEQYAHDLLSLMHVANSTDVHPPGSYFINWVLYRLTNDWHYVRLVSGVFTATALFYFYLRFTRAENLRTQLFGYLTICLSPTLLLWTTGLRWYAYFTPILMLTFCSLRRESNPWRYYFCLWFGVAILFHIGYAAIVVAPALALYAWLQRRQTIRQDIAPCITLGVIACALCLPQMMSLLHVHLANSSHQTSSMLVSIAGFALNWLSGQGAYPVAPAGISLILGNLLILGILARAPRALGEPPTLFLLAAEALFVIARLAGKFRNLVVLAPYQGLLQFRIYTLARAEWQRVLLILLFGIGNLWGLVNVATHRDTIKGSWNTPYGEALAAAEQDAQSCRKKIALTSDPVLQYALQRSGWIVATERVPSDPPSAVLDSNDCVTVFSTFRGAMSYAKHRLLFTSLDLRARDIARREFGRDDYAGFKRRFDSDVPDHYLTEIRYLGVLDSQPLGRYWTF
jgi:hypothetical protein